MQQIYQRNEKGFVSHLRLSRHTAFHKAGYAIAIHQENLRKNLLPVLGKWLLDWRTISILALIAILVASLHCCAWICLRCLTKPVRHEKPLLMEAAIIPVTIAKPHLIPPPPPPSEQKQTKPKVLRKPKLKATAPLEHKPSEFAPYTQIAESSPETPLMPESASVVSDNELPSNNTEHLTEATLDAHYADNPKPTYPAVALRQGLQGRVMLRVHVTEEGMSATVMIERSSGYEILDESAVEAVKQWRFTPARRGETAIASSVIVPIVFILEDHDQV